MPLIAALESVPVETDEVAKVVINERTGTVVMGGNVEVTACAVAHGSLTVQIANEPDHLAARAIVSYGQDSRRTAQKSSMCRKAMSV